MAGESSIINRVRGSFEKLMANLNLPSSSQRPLTPLQEPLPAKLSSNFKSPISQQQQLSGLLPQPQGGFEQRRVEEQQPLPTPSIPAGTGLADEFLQQVLPPGQELTQAFPAMGDEDFMARISGSDELRQGLANLLLLQSFFESNLGRTTPNLFGVKPGGESQHFNTPTEAYDYQVGPNVLGGGANPNMNILNTQEPMTEENIRTLYSSYDPPGAYLQDLINALFTEEQ